MRRRVRILNLSVSYHTKASFNENLNANVYVS